MKIRKRLATPSGDLPLVYEDVRLELSAPGRAVFQVVSQESVSGFIAFVMGYAVNGRDALVFAGYVERCTTMDGSQQRLMCREIAAKLDTPIPLAMRHPTLREVLAAYADKTGLRFILPERPYADTKIPAFDTFGTGLDGLANIGRAFQIPDYVWQTQGDGKIFVGSWQDSRWPERPVEIPQAVFSRALATGGKVMTLIPSMRPGCVVNGDRVRTVRFSGHEMTLGMEAEA